MDIYPVQFTVVDWNNYIKVCQDTIGVSPTRGLDENKIDTKKPSAFLYTLDLHNQPRKAIVDKRLYGHAFISFLGIATTDEIQKIAVFLPNISLTTVRGSGSKDIFIVSGTLAAFDYAIITFSNMVVHKEMRMFLNTIVRILEKAGYNEIWSGYTEVQQPDGTFTLRYK